MTTLKMWSDIEHAEVDFDISLEDESDGGGNTHKVLFARHSVTKDASGLVVAVETKRFSPSYTTEELQDLADKEAADRFLTERRAARGGH